MRKLDLPINVWNHIRLLVQRDFWLSHRKDEETFALICQKYYNHLKNRYPTIDD